MRRTMLAFRRTKTTVAAIILSVGALLAVRERARSAVPTNSARIERVVEKPVSMHARNRPLSEVAQEVEKQSSRRIAVHWLGFPPEPRASIDLDKVPFLRALAELSIASKTPIGPIGGSIGDDERQRVTFWTRASPSTITLQRTRCYFWSGNDTSRHETPLDDTWCSTFTAMTTNSGTGRSTCI